MNDVATPRARESLRTASIAVRQFRQILLWPLQLMPLVADVQIHRHWEYIATPRPDNPWCEVADEFTGDPHEFQERHYAEFVNFLPYVQRVLYGNGKGVADHALGPGAESSIRVFRRADVQAVRVGQQVHRPHRHARLLEELRQHYRRLRRKPTVWLFPGGTYNDRRPAGFPITRTGDFPYDTNPFGSPHRAPGDAGLTPPRCGPRRPSLAMLRFAALHCYDNVRQHRLPPELKDQNPNGEMWRCVDGAWTQRDIP